MGFTFDISIPLLTVFFQGILSFFSPCVLPLIPLYISYFAGGAKTVDEQGVIHYPRRKVMMHTIFFVLGVSVTFFILGYGFTTLGQFFNTNRTLFARVSGIIMILFGVYQLGLLGPSKALSREFRLPFRLKLQAMGPLTAFLLGFTFSFAWTPCIGPTLGSVLLMASSAGTESKAFWLISVYTLGFVIPFLAVGLFTGSVLDFFKRHQNVVKYTVKIGAILLILMGVMTLTGFTNGITGYLSGLGDNSGTPSTSTSTPAGSSSEEEAVEDEPRPVAPDFTLTDQYGNSHTLSDYKGKTVFLNFWATWCPPCKMEMPDIQALYEKHGENSGDIIVLGVAGPDVGDEGSVDDITAFLEDAEYTFPVVMSTDYAAFIEYGISAFPTTFMIDANGDVFGYAAGALSADIMDSIIQQTIDAVKD